MNHRTLRILEDSVLSLRVSSNKEAVSLKSSNLVAHKIAIRDPKAYDTYNYGLYKGSDDDFTNSQSVFGKSNVSNSQAAVSISIPKSVLLRAQNVLSNQSQRGRLPLVILVYQNDSLFPTEKQDNADFRINSKVVSVSFPGSSLSGLSDPVKIKLEHTDKVRLSIEILVQYNDTSYYSL